ncbi:MAG: HNH endonuclease [Planctomycetes bacterium]|nr:HNH endonuclease [Planctomycetota bacterium]
MGLYEYVGAQPQSAIDPSGLKRRMISSPRIKWDATQQKCMVCVTIYYETTPSDKWNPIFGWRALPKDVIKCSPLNMLCDANECSAAAVLDIYGSSNTDALQAGIDLEVAHALMVWIGYNALYENRWITAGDALAEAGFQAAFAAGIIIRNVRLAGGVHDKTGIPFDADGFPDFSSVAKERVRLKKGFTGNRTIDARMANELAGFDETPEGFVWHHEPDGRTMTLVPENIHSKTGHTGGVALKAAGCCRDGG